MPKFSVRTISGDILRCDKLLGRGGQGEVYSIADRPELVAKIYLQDKLAGKEKRISKLIPLLSHSLQKFAAVPLGPLYRNSGFCGFTMSRVDGVEFHRFVSTERLDLFPNARWNFFIRAAKNLAKSIHALHESGIIVGDINESNVFILKDATVRIIDCDSFQFEAYDGERFYCEVRKKEYTPPEFQDASGLLWRTKNHDCFSLAVLIFQILFINRHPFVGIPQTTGDISSSLAIKQKRFAFGVDSSARGFLPPPYILHLEEASSEIDEDFRAAFLTDARPSAMDWVTALDRLEKSLQLCPENDGHYFPGSISHCPWCRIENESHGLVVHFDPLSFNSNFDIATVWREVLRIEPPREARALPEPDGLVHSFSGGMTRRALTVTICIIVVLLLPGISPFFFAGEDIKRLFLTFAVTGLIASAVVQLVLRLRLHAPKDLRMRYDGLLNARKSLLSQSPSNYAKSDFVKRLEELKTKKLAYESLPTERANRMAQLERDAKNRQELAYLSRFRIANASIPQIGDSRRITLNSFGIETAADLTGNRVYTVPGFGPTLITNLMVWRDSIRRNFVFDASKAISKADDLAVQRDIHKKRMSLERDIRKGQRELAGITSRANAAEQKWFSAGTLNANGLVSTRIRLFPPATLWLRGIANVYVVVCMAAALGLALYISEANKPSTPNLSTTPAQSPRVESTQLTSTNTALNINTAAAANVSANTKSGDSEAVAEYKLGVTCTKAADFICAVQHYERSIELDPNSSATHHELGYARLRLGEPAIAAEEFKKAIALHPNSPESYRNLGLIYEKQNDIERACEAYKKAKSLAPKNFQVAVSFGKCLVKRDDLESAINAYKDASRLRPADAGVLYQLGELYIQVGRPDEAENVYSELVRLDSRLAERLRIKIDN